MTTATEAVLPLIPTDEERQIRAAVRGICDGFPRRLLAQEARGGRAADRALGRPRGEGLPRHQPARGVGRRRARHDGARGRRRGDRGRRQVAAPDRRLTGDRGQRSSPATGPSDQNERWLRGIAAGTTKIAFAITEPDAGTNSHNLATSLERRGDRFVLNGQKTYISGVEHAEAVLVVARSRLPDGSLGLPSLAIVDVDAPGFTRDEIPMPYLGPDKQWTLFFDDVELEEERLIGGEGGGLGPVFDGLNPERIMGAAIACGAGLRALEKAAAYANERAVWGAPIGTHQGVSHPLAEAKIELELARLMMQKAAALYDAGAPGAGEASNMAKYAAAEAAIKLRGPRDPGPRRQRLRARVRAVGHVVGRAPDADRARLARDDPQLRRRALARPAEELSPRIARPPGLRLAWREGKRSGRARERVRASRCVSRRGAPKERAGRPPQRAKAMRGVGPAPGAGRGRGWGRGATAARAATCGRPAARPAGSAGSARAGQVLGAALPDLAHDDVVHRGHHGVEDLARAARGAGEVGGASSWSWAISSA